MGESLKRTWVVNGAKVIVSFEPHYRLLDVLRDGLGLKAAKEGCGEGECGACSVLVQGELRLSCLQLAASLEDGTEILTAEGIEHLPEGETILSEANAKGAVQCGYCTPGMMVAMYWLVKNPKVPPRQGLSGNLCRCTGYQALVDTLEECRRKLAYRQG